MLSTRVEPCKKGGSIAKDEGGERGKIKKKKEEFVKGVRET